MRAPALLLVLALSGCAGSGLSAEEQKQRCTDFAATVAKAKLSSTPQRELVTKVADEMDGKLSRLGSPTVHRYAVQLHNDFHHLDGALLDKDQPEVEEALRDARAHISQLAGACKLQERDFLG